MIAIPKPLEQRIDALEANTHVELMAWMDKRFDKFEAQITTRLDKIENLLGLLNTHSE